METREKAATKGLEKAASEILEKPAPEEHPRGLREGRGADNLKVTEVVCSGPVVKIQRSFKAHAYDHGVHESAGVHMTCVCFMLCLFVCRRFASARRRLGGTSGAMAPRARASVAALVGALPLGFRYGGDRTSEDTASPGGVGEGGFRELPGGSLNRSSR